MQNLSTIRSPSSTPDSSSISSQHSTRIHTPKTKAEKEETISSHEASNEKKAQLQKKDNNLKPNMNSSIIKQAGNHSFVIETTYPDGSKYEYPSSKALQYAEKILPLSNKKTALTA